MSIRCRFRLVVSFAKRRLNPLSWKPSGKQVSLLIIITLALIFWLKLPLSTKAGADLVAFKGGVKSMSAASLHRFNSAADEGSFSQSTGLFQPTTICDTYYLHNQMMSVGDDGSQSIANTAVPTATSPSVIQATLPVLSGNNVEIARFYTDPPVPLNYSLIGDISGSIWLQSTDFSNTTFTVSMFDYNPVNGNLIDLGDIEFIIITDGQNEVELVITPPSGSSVAANHRLLLILYAKSPVLTAPTVSLFYNSVERDSQFTFCHPTPPQLTITKSGPAATVAGRPISYTLTIANSGALVATNLVISDTLPTGATYISGGALNGNVVSWFADSLAPKTSIQRSFVVTASQTITNDGYEVKADGNFSARGQKAVVTVVSPPGQPNLVISKNGPSEVKIGELITYTLTITNSGDVAASSVRITDTLPTAATYISSSDGTLNGNAVTWLVDAPLDPQTSLERSFVVAATQAITNEDYKVAAAPSFLTIGQNAVTTQVVPRKIYLPVTIKPGEQEALTTLRIDSQNTDGISLVQILRADNSKEVLSCKNIGNNTLVTCGTFNAVGSYKIIAKTNRCGTLQGTFNDATPGVVVIRTVRCN